MNTPRSQGDIEDDLVWLGTQSAESFIPTLVSSEDTADTPTLRKSLRLIQQLNKSGVVSIDGQEGVNEGRAARRLNMRAHICCFTSKRIGLLLWNVMNASTDKIVSATPMLNDSTECAAMLGPAIPVTSLPTGLPASPTAADHRLAARAGDVHDDNGDDPRLLEAIYKVRQKQKRDISHRDYGHRVVSFTLIMRLMPTYVAASELQALNRNIVESDPTAHTRRLNDVKQRLVQDMKDGNVVLLECMDPLHGRPSSQARDGLLSELLHYMRKYGRHKV